MILREQWSTIQPYVRIDELRPAVGGIRIFVHDPISQEQIHIADLEGTTSTTFNSILSLLTCSLDLIKAAKLPLSLAY